MAKSITIKRYNGTTWEEMYPKTSAKNILTGGVHGKITSAMVESVATTQVSGLITNGKITEGLLPALAITNVITETSPNSLASFYDFYDAKNPADRQAYAQEGDVVILTVPNITLIKTSNSSLAGNEVFTELKTPADAAIGALTGRVGTLETKVSAAEAGIDAVDNKVDNLNLNSIDGTLSVSKGGTGRATLAKDFVLVGDGTNDVKLVEQVNITQIDIPQSQVTGLAADLQDLATNTNSKVDKINISSQTSKKLRKFAYNAQGQVTSSEDYVYASGDFPILEASINAKADLIQILDSNDTAGIQALNKTPGNIYFEYTI